MGMNPTFKPRLQRHRRSNEQERLQGIVERMADGVVIVGMEGRIRFANPAAEQL